MNNSGKGWRIGRSIRRKTSADEKERLFVTSGSRGCCNTTMAGGLRPVGKRSLPVLDDIDRQRTFKLAC